jgi:hypothetical protein
MTSIKYEIQLLFNTLFYQLHNILYINNLINPLLYVHK